MIGVAPISGRSQLIPLGKEKTGQIGRNLLTPDKTRAIVRVGIASTSSGTSVRNMGNPTGTTGANRKRNT